MPSLKSEIDALEMRIASAGVNEQIFEDTLRPRINYLKSLVENIPHILDWIAYLDQGQCPKCEHSGFKMCAPPICTHCGWKLPIHPNRITEILQEAIQ